MTVETKQLTAMDKMRKQLLAAVCQYLETMNVKDFTRMDTPARMNYAKGVVCRAARVGPDSFNRIGRVRLRSLTAMFNKMRRDMDSVTEETIRILEGGTEYDAKTELIGLN